MNRENLLESLKLYQPAGPKEAAEKDMIQAFVENTPTCFERIHETGGHVTGSAWIVNKDRTKVLLIHHKKIGLWMQPGGHCDGEGDVAAVAMQEVLEETGLSSATLPTEAIFDVDVHSISALDDVPAHKHYDIRYLVEADENEPLTIAERELNNARWFALEDIPATGIGKSVPRMVNKTKLL